MKRHKRQPVLEKSKGTGRKKNKRTMIKNQYVKKDKILNLIQAHNGIKNAGDFQRAQAISGCVVKEKTSYQQKLQHLQHKCPHESQRNFVVPSNIF